MTSRSSAPSERVSVLNRSATAFPGKRAVNLTLNDNLVLRAKSYIANLSATVEALLTDYVAAQQLAQVTREEQAVSWCADCNAVHLSVGSFADERTTS